MSANGTARPLSADVRPSLSVQKNVAHENTLPVKGKPGSVTVDLVGANKRPGVPVATLKKMNLNKVSAKVDTGNRGVIARPRSNTVVVPATKHSNPPLLRPRSASSVLSGSESPPESTTPPKTARLPAKKESDTLGVRAVRPLTKKVQDTKPKVQEAVPKSTNKGTSLALQTKAREIARLQRVLDAAEKRSKLGDINSMEFYDMGKQLGEGAFAQVKMAQHKMLGEKVAVKVFDKRLLHNDVMKRRLNHEIDIMKKLDHENIVKIFETASNLQRFFIVMEYCEQGTLSSYVKSKGEGSERKLTEDEARRIFRQVVDAVDYCHKKKVIHRDIKMENILLDSNMDVRIADFGLSTKVPQSKYLSGFCGTPNYVAPEVCLGGRYRGETADWWSVGVLLYRIVCGSFPFYGSDQFELKKAIMKGKFAFPKELSTSCKSMIASLMKNKPEERLSVDSIRSHPWMVGSEGFETDEQQRSILDPEVLSHVASLGFDANFVVKSVGENAHNTAYAFYKLALQKKRRTGSLAVPVEVQLTPRGFTPPSEVRAAVDAAILASDVPA